MWTRGLGKKVAGAAVVASVLISGCGLDVEIIDDPDPATIGKPVKYSVDVKFVGMDTAENSALLVLLLPGTAGLCDLVDDFDPAALSAGDPLAQIEENLPENVLSALPAGMSVEALAARLGGAVQAATSQAEVTCEQLAEPPDDDVPLGATAFLCMLGDIPSGQTETAMFEFVPEIPGVLTAAAIAVACGPDEPAEEGGGAGIVIEDPLFFCNGEIPEFVGFDCEETVVQGGFAVPLASTLALAVLAAALGGVGVVARRRRRSNSRDELRR